MKKHNGIISEHRTHFFGNSKKEGELDESTFSNWKSELLQNLPEFWEEMTEMYRK